MVVAVTAYLAPGNLQQRVPCSWRAQGAARWGGGAPPLQGAPTARRLGVTWSLCTANWSNIIHPHKAQQIHVPSNTSTHNIGTSGFRSWGRDGCTVGPHVPLLVPRGRSCERPMMGDARSPAQQWPRGPNISRLQLKDSLFFSPTGMDDRATSQNADEKQDTKN
ncbi:predicted protein [Chaetomium globosum CBS 148.51]|uniref:Uncharacterized protein n=1 Tax=Chaetomium globosum (strain ATCC 6205 / CBS 148.51 / DSM 1962 / NBRC 6347 / NRRL 1970) TaxID=306901 RepID=Q2HF59_CHAGB|nr:uncharacterized protein CHGG_01145 [Chaetomium globosum CBS 148.51]EAQ92910.1 predicted protein [Chaetomium globosum CBS 148.51]